VALPLSPESGRIEAKGTTMGNRYQTALDDGSTEQQYRELLASVGASDELSSWLIENLTDAQFDSLAAFSRGGAGDETGPAERPSGIAAACLRAMRKMPHLRTGQHGLSARELQKCNAKGIDPAKYAANKARMM
jgi:hypothetical protein